MAEAIDVDTFISLHQQQFQSIGLPNHLWEALYRKLIPERVYDTFNAFELRKSGEQTCRKWSLHTKRDLRKESEVWLVDHEWSSDGAKLAQVKLQKDAKLFLAMKDLMIEEEEDDDDNNEGNYLDKREVVIQITNAKPKIADDALKHSKGDLIDAVAVIKDGKIDLSSEHKMNKIVQDKLSESSLLSYEDFKAGFLAEYENRDVSEQYMKKLYQNYVKDKESESKEGEKEDTNGGTTLQYTWTEENDGTITAFVTIPVICKKADIVNKITSHSWEFGVKGAPPLVKGQFFSRVHPDESFWTFDSPGLMQVLIQKEDAEVSWPELIKGEEQLSTRNIDAKAHKKEEELTYEIEQVLETMWKYNQTYQATIGSSGIQESVWYVMDKFGSAVGHSTQPNLCCMPFASVTTGVFYSLFWPIRDIQKNEVCLRNACPQMHTETALQHQARMLAFEEHLPERCPLEFILFSVELDKASENVTPPDISVEPFAENCENLTEGMTENLKFYTDVQTGFFISSLKDLGCTLVSSPEEANVLWVAAESPSLGKLDQKCDQKVNRFKGEESLLKKNVLSYLIKMTLGKPSWYPATYDLKSQLASVVSDHYERAVDNYWIVKSYNRKKLEFEPVVSSNLQRLARLSEMPPLVASHYNCTSALYNLKRKFCLQFSVVITSLDPLNILLHNTPLIKLAEKATDPHLKLDEYDPSTLIAVVQNKAHAEIQLKDFLENLNKNYFLRLNLTWEDVRSNIAKAIGELFHAVCPSLSGYSSSCGIYGVDILLAGDLQPLIIGVDEVPVFASQDVLSDVLKVSFSSCDNKAKLICAKNFTKITV